MTGLVSSDDERSLARIDELSRAGAPGLSSLLAMFQNRSWTVRRALVATLARGDDATLEELARSLVDQRAHEPTIAGIVDALSAASAQVDPIARRLLDHPEAAILCDAAQICGRRNDRAAIPRLVELSDHADDNVALAAIEALGRISSPQASERLIAIAEGHNFFRIFPAIDALGRARESRAVPALLKLLKLPLYAVEAARALGRVGSLSAIGPLVQAMTAGPEALLRVAAAGLTSLHDLAVQSVGVTSVVSRVVRENASPVLRDKLMRALASAEGSEAVALGRMLTWLANEDSVEDLVALLGAADDVATLALEGLVKISAVADPRVLAALREGSSEVRKRLLPALMGLAAATDAVVACLGDEQPAVRALACHALARGGDTAPVPALFRLLLDADLGVVHAAVGAIQSLGTVETERLAVAAARSTNEGERRAALRIVTYFGYEQSLELCSDALRSSDERLRDVALAGLPALEDPRAVALLLETASHPAPRTRAAAIRAIGHVGNSRDVLDVVRKALADPDGWVRYYACQSLGRLKAVEALPAIAERLQDPTGHVKMAAIEALAALPGKAASDALAEAARSDNADLQRAAIVGIGERREASLRPVVLAALDSPDTAIRVVAVSSLARFEGGESDLARIVKGDADPAVRRAATELLASRNDPEASDALIELLAADPASHELGGALAQAVERRIPRILSRLQGADDALSRALLAVLSRAESRAGRAAIDSAFESPNASARRAAARVLAALADDAAKATLAGAAAMDSDAEVRRICIAAIA